MCLSVVEDYSAVWIHYILFIHSSFDGHLGHFHPLAIAINDARTFRYKFLCGHKLSFLLGIYSGVELLGTL